MRRGLSLTADDWVRGGSYAVRGSAFVDGSLADADALRDRLAGAAPATPSALAAAVEDWAGKYAAVIDRGDAVLAVTDPTRSTALFFSTTAPLRLSDDGTALGDELGDDPSPAAYEPVARAELLTSRFVGDRRTLVGTMRSVRAGEAVALREEGGSVRWEAVDASAPRPTTRATGDAESAIERVEDALATAAERTVRYADGRPIAVWLSGGYDSRLVLTALAETGYDDLVALTFGRRGVPDVERAEAVADELGVRWEFAEYATARWREWYDTADARAFRERYFEYESVPNYGMLPAIEDLRASGRLPDDVVFCPGQTSHGLSSYEPPESFASASVDPEDVAAYFVDRRYSLWDWSDEAFERAVRDRVAASLDPLDDPGTAYVAGERWRWRNYVTKYLLQDGRQYDWTGDDWWYPLWDAAVVDAWERVPREHRVGKELTERVADRRYAAATGRDAAAVPEGVEATGPFGGLLDGVVDRIAASAVGPLLAPLYWRAVRSAEGYDDHPLGWWGVVPRPVFDACYSGREIVHAFQALAAAGRVSLDGDGAVYEAPEDGRVELHVDDAGDRREPDGAE
jgi:asparagine synthase (glutamine-hydrolysing)